jgi:uncharacterized protein DUF3224
LKYFGWGNMQTKFGVRRRLTEAVCLCSWLGISGQAQQSPAARIPAAREKVVTSHASGTFDVKLAPQAAESGGPDAGLARMSIDKQFHGGLEGTSKGFMLASSATIVKGSGGYVAMERFTGALMGRTGSFVLQHSGTMTRGTPQLSVTVVPDSGTGQLLGLTGTLVIKIDEGKHSYEFDYALPDTP